MIIVVWGSSCSEYLEYEETDLIAGDVALKTIENHESAIIGAYGGLSDLMDVLLNGVFSDELMSPGEFYNAATVHEWQYGPQDVSIRDTYTAINPQYTTIDRVNRVLALIDEAEATRDGDEEVRQRLKGEAYFLRAWAHFELFRYYCPKISAAEVAMPYMEEPSLDDQARIPVNEYFQKLYRDIELAKSLLPNNLSDIARANVAAAQGLHARIALYSEAWEEAETYASNYINTSGLGLSTIEEFPKIWNDSSVAEQAMHTVRITGMSRVGSLFRGTSSIDSDEINIGTIIWTVSSKLYNSYTDADVRFDTYFIDEPLLQAAGRTSIIIKKYAGGDYGTATENVAHSKLIRTAEMYLIRAEARAEQGKITGDASAESDLNYLRANRITGYVDVTLSSKDEAIDAILLERFKELPFEGHRFWDLKRRGRAVERLLEDSPSSVSTTLPADNFRFTLPIPDSELKANGLMEQNDGY